MTQTETHGALMDDVYRYQRLFYDVTRKYYLLGRDHLISGIDAAPEADILEVACGTGRNLAKVGQRYPGRALYGFDISKQMLVTARNKLGDRAALAEGDACAFNPQDMFGRTDFDHIVLSYCLSMIPDWEGALREATRHLAPGGTLHIVDFGDQTALPAWFKRALRNWLGRFHVSPRDGMKGVLDDLPSGFEVSYLPLYRHYAVYARVTRSA
jgi:S-adenosylmethionine-diacylgycerolhomoserine-N-methlytransferase